MLTEEEILRRWDGLDATLKAEFSKLTGLSGRLSELEKLLAASSRGTGNGDHATPGRSVIESPEFKAFGGSLKRGKFAVSVKTITSLSTSGGALAPPARDLDPALMGRRPLRLRDVLPTVPTGSNSIEYPRQSTRTNAAAVVTEGSAKPESDYAFTLQTAPVRTIAHWIPASRQILDDAPQLQATIDAELKYGLALEEEDEILNGDGTGSHLLGIVTQATAFNAEFVVASKTRFDTLLLAILQSELAGFPADVIVLHPTDVAQLLATKDGQQRYIGGGPLASSSIVSVWGRPVVATQAIDATEFLVGSTLSTTLYDRLQAEVTVSTEHDDYFVRNLVAIRAESRLALAVKRPESWISGDFDVAT